MRALRRPPGTPEVFQRKTVFARARRLCLSLPEVSEASSHGHPIFRVGTTMFCAFEIHQKRPSIAVRIPAVEFDAPVTVGRIFATPYGRGAWTSLWVDGDIDWMELATLVRMAYDGVAGKRTRSLASRGAAAAHGHAK